MAKSAGGLKGLIQMTGKTVYGASLVVRDYGTLAARWGYKYGGFVAFTVATTSMIVLMPLVFESIREVQVRCSARLLYPRQPSRCFRTPKGKCPTIFAGRTHLSNHLDSHCAAFVRLQYVQMLENERMQVKELKNRGYSVRQLQDMGYSESSLHTPSVALAAKQY
jgi:hypothetical protein